MVNMENAEEVMQILDRFTRLKQKEIPKELDEYLQYVAKTGDTVFKWSSLKYLFREKLLNVIKHFHDTTPRVDEIPQYPNVDPFNYESMKSSLLERLELFNAAPFTIQRLCELLIDPRKQYSRLDKFMRALEKNILVVSTIEPGRKRAESENGDSLDSVVNGDLSLDVNVDIDMENESLFNMETQNGNGTAAPEADATAEESKENRPVTSETSNAKHTADDDILPNPKKAKLDLDEDDEEKQKQQEESASKAVEKTKTEAGSEVEAKSEAEVVVAVAGEKKEIEVDAANKDDVATDGDADMPEVKDVEAKDVGEKSDERVKEDGNEKSADDKPESKQEKAVAVVEKEEKLLKEVVKEKERKVEEEEETKKIEKPEVEAEIDAVKKKEKVQVESNGENKTATEKQDEEVELDDEKIIEKQETEKGEKEDLTPIADVAADNKKTEVVGGDEEKIEETKKVAVAEETNEKAAAKVEEPKEDKTETDAATAVAAADKVVAEIAEIVIVAENTKNEAEKNIPLHSVSETKAADGKLLEDEKAVESPTAVTPAAEAACTTETKQTVKAADTDEIISSSSPSSSIIAQVEKTEAQHEKAIETKETAKETKVEADNAATISTTTITAATNELDIPNASDTVTSSPTPIEADPTDGCAIEENLPAAAAPVVELATAKVSTAVGISAAAVVATTATTTATDVHVVAAVAVSTTIPPTLTLNDQPMDDVPLEELPPTIDEVVMAETGGATAMATDAIEPNKDEPAGMEVDDTSQEAMDQ